MDRHHAATSDAKKIFATIDCRRGRE